MLQTPMIDKDGEVRELTAEDFKQFRPIREFFEERWGAEKTHAFLAASERRVGVRGKQKAPTKVQVALRLPEEVVTYFKASGKGWQTRIGTILREYIASHP
jgi:uncharacterized protein (DUF4415 family)